MNFKIVLLLTLVSVALARPEGERSYGQDSYEDAKYSFEWEVDDDSSENHFGHDESRDGDRTEGSYYVLLPDTRTMKVTYYVDGDSGFVSNIEFEGTAKFDDHKEGSYSS